LAGVSTPIGGTQDPGFFTSVSSAGAGPPLIWAVSRPNNHQKADGSCEGDPTIYLYAFNGVAIASTLLPPVLSPLIKLPAGIWPTCTGDANIVPVVANGKVYVASYKELAIFGLK